MAEALAEQVVRQVAQSSTLYHRLTLVVARAGAGKTRGLQEARDRLGAPLVNVNLELSRRLLELTERQRALQVPRLLDEIASKADSAVVLLDNIEILFDVSLNQDPLRLLQGISRNRTVVAAWNGSIEKGLLTYAAPGHPEYRKYPVEGFLVVGPDAPSQDPT